MLLMRHDRLLLGGLRLWLRRRLLHDGLADRRLDGNIVAGGHKVRIVRTGRNGGHVRICGGLTDRERVPETYIGMSGI